MDRLVCGDVLVTPPVYEDYPVWGYGQALFVVGAARGGGGGGRLERAYRKLTPGYMVALKREKERCSFRLRL